MPARDRGPGALAPGASRARRCERAEAALALARQTKSRLWQVEALRSLAEIHATHRPAPGEANDASAALRFLDEALGVVESIGGHHEKSQLYTEIARAHEAAGDPVRALGAERAARAEEVKEQNRRAANRMLLARERHETERQRVEAELQRSLAAAETERAARAARPRSTRSSTCARWARTSPPTSTRRRCSRPSTATSGGSPT